MNGTSSSGVAAHPPAASALALDAERRHEAASEHQPIAGLAWMALASSLFAAMNLLARLASAHAGWTVVAASRTLIGAATALAVALARGASLRIVNRGLGWARAVTGTCAMLCVFYTLGAPKIALGDVVTLGATSPIFVSLLSPRMLGEASGPGLWLATLVAFAGIALVAGPELALAGHLAAIAVLGALLSAFAMIWLRKLGSRSVRESPEAIALHFSLVASAVMVALAIPTWKTPDPTGAALLVGTGLCGGLAQLAMTRAYALDRAARVGAVGYLGVALTHVLGVVWLDEKPAAHQVLGAAFVVAAGLGLAAHALREQRRSLGS